MAGRDPDERTDGGAAFRAADEDRDADDADEDDADEDDADEDDDDEPVELAESSETVDEAVERVLRELPGVERVAGADGTEVSIAGRAFAVVSAGSVEVRLDPAIAAAAIRTPGVTGSARGPGWVRFAPVAGSRSPLDVDRMIAWLRLAHRAASPT